ncbi:PREDICTED: uncharacterized protein LOC104700947 isoform X2 [Camelina sativa]|uniref:Uncharacterized protein LOC104700947 isoform X2 n=1 Tax=Camelina sativa TaxID=90675 RepID=A0ABM0SQY3_CAMSA|nr:PREDICTED: uncharacterized protein LOC104700947 isoform X2 [Camelina sativa]
MEITPKRYLRRWRGYEKLDGSSSSEKKPGRRTGKRVKMDPTRKKRFWRIKIVPKLRILKKASPKKFFVWLRDSYVKMMMPLANSRVVGSSGYGGSGLGSGPAKEYDEKMLVEIYKTILMAQAQGNLVHRDTPNNNINNKVAFRKLLSLLLTMEVTDLWREIEHSESYLVCSMFEEAKSSSSSILKTIFSNIDVLSEEEAFGDHQLHDLLESAGMVLVQSLHGISRTIEIVNELRNVFDEIAAIPVQVLLTGICLQISNGSYSGVSEILQDFFSIWVYKDNHYTLNDAGVSAKGLHGKISIDIDEFLEVVELYIFGVLAKVSDDVGLAISWIEKAALPEDRRQGLLRRLQSLLSLKTTNVPVATSLEEDSKDSSSYAVVNKPKDSKNYEIDSGLKLSKQHEPSPLWSSHPLSFKLGNTQFSMSKGKIAISLVGLIICYALKRKQATLIRQMESTRKTFVDFWKLAFSYQVNPLAAIQSIPNSTT